jgi:hypothetical protein
VVPIKAPQATLQKAHHDGRAFSELLVAWGGIEPPTQGFLTLIDRFELVVFQQSNTVQIVPLQHGSTIAHLPNQRVYVSPVHR